MQRLNVPLPVGCRTHTPGLSTSLADLNVLAAIKPQHLTQINGDSWFGLAFFVTSTDGGECEEGAGNVRLYKAAPAMLSALKAMDAFWTQDCPEGPDGPGKVMFGLATLTEDTREVWRNIRAAIAEAEGRS